MTDDRLGTDDFNWPLGADADEHHRWYCYDAAAAAGDELLVLVEDHGESATVANAAEVEARVGVDFPDMEREALRHRVETEMPEATMRFKKDALVPIESPVLEPVDETLLSLDVRELRRQDVDDLRRALRIRARDADDGQLSHHYHAAADALDDARDHLIDAEGRYRDLHGSPPSEKQRHEEVRESMKGRDLAVDDPDDDDDGEE